MHIKNKHFKNSLRNTISVKQLRSSWPDISSGLILVQSVCKGYQQKSPSEFLFGLRFYVSVNSYGHVETVGKQFDHIFTILPVWPKEISVFHPILLMPN